MAEVATVTDIDFDAHVMQKKEPILVDFWAEWCGPCKAIAPALASLANDFAGSVRIAKVDIDKNEETRSRFGIRGIPLLVLFSDGKEIARTTGAQSKAKLSAFLEANLGKPSQAPSDVNEPLTYVAYHGSDEIKQRSLTNLEAAAARDAVLPGVTQQDEQGSSPCACAAEAGTPEECASVLGFPPAIVELIDVAATYYGTASAGAQRALTWLEGVPAGMHLASLPAAAMQIVLTSGLVDEHVDDKPALAEFRDRIVKLHLTGTQGATAAEWAALRKEVREITKDDPAAAITDVLEKACFSLTDSDVVRDVFVAVSFLPTAGVSEQLGWTAADEQRTMHTLGEISSNQQAHGSANPPQALKELARVEPDLFARFVQNSEARQEAIRSVGQDLAAAILEKDLASHV